MKSPFGIRIPFSITIKPLLFVLPLVCIPIAIVGYLSYEASVESVTRLSRNEQMLQAKGAAAEINTVFQSCCRDLEAIAEYLPEAVQFNRTHQLQTYQEEDRERILKLFRDFSSRSPYYIQIRLLDTLGQEVITPRLEGQDKRMSRQSAEASFWSAIGNGEQGCHVSRITYSELHEGFVVQFSKPLFHSDDDSKAGTERHFTTYCPPAAHQEDKVDKLYRAQ